MITNMLKCDICDAEVDPLVEKIAQIQVELTTMRLDNHPRAPFAINFAEHEEVMDDRFTVCLPCSRGFQTGIRRALRDAAKLKPEPEVKPEVRYQLVDMLGEPVTHPALEHDSEDLKEVLATAQVMTLAGLEVVVREVS